MTIYTEMDIQRFWRWVKIPSNQDDCWLWIGGIKENGYGQLSCKPIGKKRTTVGAHVFSYNLHFGEIQNGLYACHKPPCVNRHCVNPSHLYAGTQKQNLADAIALGRIATGERNGTHTHPENVARGERSGAYTHPEKRAIGDKNGSRIHPERLTRGENHWTFTHPEKRLYGDKNGARKHPETRARGIKNGNAKLTEEIANDIRQEYKAGGITQMNLAEKYKLNICTINAVLTNKIWVSA